MSSLYHDSRLYYILGANSLSAIGSGIVMITIPWLLIKEGGERQRLVMFRSLQPSLCFY